MRDISPVGLLLDVDGSVASGDLPDVTAGVEDLLAERGLAEHVRVAPSVISVDVEHRSSGKVLGVERCFDLLAEAGTPVPERWLTAGESLLRWVERDLLR